MLFLKMVLSRLTKPPGFICCECRGPSSGYTGWRTSISCSVAWSRGRARGGVPESGGPHPTAVFSVWSCGFPAFALLGLLFACGVALKMAEDI